MSRCSEPAGSDPVGSKFQNRPESSGQHCTSSLKTRSMDAGFSRNHRSHQSATSRSKDVWCFIYAFYYFFLLSFLFKNIRIILSLFHLILIRSTNVI